MHRPEQNIEHHRTTLGQSNDAKSSWIKPDSKMNNLLIRVTVLVFKEVLYLLDELMVVSVTSKVGDITPPM